MVDEGTGTEAYIHTLALSFPHIIKMKEIELEVVYVPIRAGGT